MYKGLGLVIFFLLIAICMHLVNSSFFDGTFTDYQVAVMSMLMTTIVVLERIHSKMDMVHQNVASFLILWYADFKKRAEINEDTKSD